MPGDAKVNAIFILTIKETEIPDDESVINLSRNSEEDQIKLSYVRFSRGIKLGSPIILKFRHMYRNYNGPVYYCLHAYIFNNSRNPTVENKGLIKKNEICSIKDEKNVVQILQLPKLEGKKVIKFKSQKLDTIQKTEILLKIQQTLDPTIFVEMDGLKSPGIEIKELEWTKDNLVKFYNSLKKRNLEKNTTRRLQGSDISNDSTNQTPSEYYLVFKNRQTVIQNTTPVENPIEKVTEVFTASYLTENLRIPNILSVEIVEDQSLLNSLKLNNLTFNTNNSDSSKDYLTVKYESTLNQECLYKVTSGVIPTLNKDYFICKNDEGLLCGNLKFDISKNGENNTLNIVIGKINSGQYIIQTYCQSLADKSNFIFVNSPAVDIKYNEVIDCFGNDCIGNKTEFEKKADCAKKNSELTDGKIWLWDEASKICISNTKMLYASLLLLIALLVLFDF